jgi:hypothetical protein
MDQVEEGVANFRAFQLENRDFMGWSRRKREEDELRDKRRSKIHFALLALLTGLIIAMFTVMLEHYSKGNISLFPHATNMQPQNAHIPLP